MKISACIPCYNAAPTICQAIQSLRDQTVPVDELFVVDDGSTDNSVQFVENLGVRVIRMEKNMGRGAVRARTVSTAMHDLILSCDATNRLPNNFLTLALPWLKTDRVAVVFGRMVQEAGGRVAARWRGRHLFRSDIPLAVNRRSGLATGAVLMRKSHILDAGNFDPDLRQNEDAELGARLLAKGYEVVFDPDIHTSSICSNNVIEVLERYWRWNTGPSTTLDWRAYKKQIVYSLKVMAIQDFKARDPFSVPISLLSPHYQFYKTLIAKLRKDPVSNKK